MHWKRGGSRPFLRLIAEFGLEGGVKGKGREMRASEDLFQRDGKKNAVVREKAARDEHVLGPKGGREGRESGQ